jgi:hypothetical protein
MPAASKSQQRLMGLVRAVQKGDREAPNLKIKQMAQDMDTKDVKDYASTPTKGLPDKKEAVDPAAFIQNYNEYGKILHKSARMQELAEKLSQIAEFAESKLMDEAGDWYDGHTIKRNMKEMKGYAGDFVKLATEADTIHQRMTALYDDMGHVLQRYFEVQDISEESETDTATPEEYKGENAKREPTVHPAPQVHEDYGDDTERVIDKEFSGIGTQESFSPLEERLVNVIRKSLTPEQCVRFEGLSRNNKLRFAVRAIR